MFLSPTNRHLLADKEGGWLQNGVDNTVSREIFGTHVAGEGLRAFVLVMTRENW